MREVVGVGEPGAGRASSLRQVTPREAAHERAVAECLSEERQLRREALLHRLALARARRRRSAPRLA